MKKLILTAGVLTALAIPAASQASCGSLSCVNRQLTTLKKQVSLDTRILRVDTRALSSLTSCLGEFALSQYGDVSGTFGYQFNAADGSPIFNTSALDVTQSGDAIGAWVMTDRCNQQTTRAAVVRGAAAIAKAAGAIAPEVSFGASGDRRITR